MTLEDSSVVSRKRARGGHTRRGVRPGHEEDGPVNWEIPFTPPGDSGRKESLVQTISNGHAEAGTRVTRKMQSA